MFDNTLAHLLELQVPFSFLCDSPLHLVNVDSPTVTELHYLGHFLERWQVTGKFKRHSARVHVCAGAVLHTGR